MRRDISVLTADAGLFGCTRVLITFLLYLSSSIFFLEFHLLPQNIHRCTIVFVDGGFSSIHFIPYHTIPLHMAYLTQQYKLKICANFMQQTK